MLRIPYILLMLTAVSAGFLHADEDDKKRNRAERRLQNQEARARKMQPPKNNDELAEFLTRETQRLMERSKTLSRPSYEFDRILEAVDDLLDAREDLLDAERETRDEDENTAKRLERAYFRVQQGEYFAKLSGDKQAREYVLRSRQLYQKGRAAYDRREFQRARKLASASSELVNVLENLAQAAVRKPEPPVLK